ncbi:MAG: 30S ribosomal protein S9 [Capsulimonas sp.]|jgi:small subunit ribosomal protein S9|uniref:Small ribosomal subunit protein uS9 n=1 Tax=Capsulimonas corticalis TaxID=2219043 RepID=A0A402CYD8_9BACT|nr:30S ribosomal protein S9 [Capsulimonas corticalis]MCW3059292.1 ribosomal protein [Capsulimonas sp.]BDI31341.1 30S ribosomal protein S9 [Capsulimonas corticalis]
MATTTRYYGTGHRKNATAKVWLTPGEGNIVVNNKQPLAYFGRVTLEALIRQPLEVTETLGKFDIWAKTLGGGISGQAGAMRHGISKALVEADPDLRPALRKLGFLTRDPRVKERKKAGRKRARRGFQFSKR